MCRPTSGQTERRLAQPRDSGGPREVSTSFNNCSGDSTGFGENQRGKRKKRPSSHCVRPPPRLGPAEPRSCRDTFSYGPRGHQQGGGRGDTEGSGGPSPAGGGGGHRGPRHPASGPLRPQGGNGPFTVCFGLVAPRQAEATPGASCFLGGSQCPSPAASLTRTTEVPRAPGSGWSPHARLCSAHTRSEARVTSRWPPDMSGSAHRVFCRHRSWKSGFSRTSRGSSNDPPAFHRRKRADVAPEWGERLRVCRAPHSLVCPGSQTGLVHSAAFPACPCGHLDLPPCPTALLSGTHFPRNK